ncbi:MAG: CvpA family protein [Chitinophagales bacterium]
MNWLDLGITGLVAFAGVRGLKRGLGREAIGLGATALLLFCALPAARPLGLLVTRTFWPAGELFAPAVGFLLLSLAVGLVTSACVSVWRWLMAALSLSWLDAAAGALFGVAKALVVSLVVVVLLSWLPLPPVRSLLTGSAAATTLLEFAPGLYRQVERLAPPGWQLPLAPPPRLTPHRIRRPMPGNWQEVDWGRPG